MDDTAGFSALRQVLIELFGSQAADIGRDATAADVPGWDSMQMITIILTLQERYGLLLGNQDIDRLHCVGDLADQLDRHLKASGVTIAGSGP